MLLSTFAVNTLLLVPMRRDITELLLTTSLGKERPNYRLGALPTRALLPVGAPAPLRRLPTLSAATISPSPTRARCFDFPG